MPIPPTFGQFERDEEIYREMQAEWAAKADKLFQSVKIPFEPFMEGGKIELKKGATIMFSPRYKDDHSILSVTVTNLNLSPEDLRNLHAFLEGNSIGCS